MSKDVEVQILGRGIAFSIPDEIDEIEFKKIIEYLEAKFKRIKEKNMGIDGFRLTLLAAINIAEELHSVKRENDKMKSILTNIDSIVSNTEKEGQTSISFSS